MPENRAVMETAIFMMLVSTPRSSAMTGAMFSVVWAKSQNASTPNMMPNKTLSFPTNSLLLTVAVGFFSGIDTGPHWLEVLNQITVQLYFIATPQFTALFCIKPIPCIGCGFIQHKEDYI